MLPFYAAFVLLLRVASAVFADEAYNIDYHYALLGEPQESTTFFHRPNLESRASLIYTLSEQNVVGALNPKDGNVVWRQLLQPSVGLNATFLRAVEGAEIVIAGIGSQVDARSAGDGKLAWTYKAAGELKDLEILEFGSSKDAIILHEGAVVRLDETTGAVKWLYKIESGDAPYQISLTATRVYVILLHKTMLGYLKIKVFSLDPANGHKLDEYTLSSENELATAESILTVGANTASPIIAWTDAAYTTLKVNVLGNKNIASFSTQPGKAPLTRIILHAPFHVNSLTHFLVHYQAEQENWAEVYHIDVKSGKVDKAYDLPSYGNPSVFSTSTVDANVYFTRISKDEVVTVSSASHGVLGRWKISSFATAGTDISTHPLFAATELSVKGNSVSAIRSAVWLSSGELVLLRDGAAVWHRPEALADIVKAEFVLPVVAEKLAQELKATKSDNPVAAYLRRVSRHLTQIPLLGSQLGRLPQDFIDGVFGLTAETSNTFGFDQSIVCTTRKGHVFTLDAGKAGRIRRTSPEAIEKNRASAASLAAQTAIEYKQKANEIEAYTPDSQAPLWTFASKDHERILSISSRPEDDPVASIGVVLGNRNVLYKYLNPNMALVTTVSDSKRCATFHIIDTVSGAVLHASTHQDVDLSMPITASLSENWFAYSFTAETTDASPKGHFLVGGELYESLSANDRGLLDASTNFSSLASDSTPFVLSQRYHIPEPISKMAVTQTRQGITSKQLIVVLPESNSIAGIPKSVLDPRRPNRDPTKEEQMEGLVKYNPTLEIDPRWHLNHKREVLGVKDVIASPALLESTSLVFAYGLDIFGTRLSPSFNFDMLGKDFNKFQMLSTVAALAVATVVVGPLVMRKQVNARWSLFS